MREPEVGVVQKCSRTVLVRWGFSASRICLVPGHPGRSPSLGKIVPYLIGEYLTSDPTVALKYSRQKEIHNEPWS